MAQYYYVTFSDGYAQSFYSNDEKGAHKEAAKEAIGRYIKTIKDENGYDTFYDIGRGGWLEPSAARREASKSVTDADLLAAAKYGIARIGKYNVNADGENLLVIPVDGMGEQIAVREKRGKQEVFRTFNVEIKITEVLPSVHKWINGICEGCKADLFDVADPSGECNP